MCGTCGCSTETHRESERFQSSGQVHELHVHELHGHELHGHELHGHELHDLDGHRPMADVDPLPRDHTQVAESRVIDVERRILARNEHIAAHNREWFGHHRVLVLNLVSSPGSGKTALLERTVRELRAKVAVRVIEGDQATEADADRIRSAGAPAVQVNTGTGCHLDAAMVARALGELSVPDGSILFIENVGNLVCPALFDLGEEAKVLVTSVTEGDDKPIKYPHMFRAAKLLVLNKIDLLPYVSFDAGRFRRGARQVNPDVQIIEVSATRGDGLSGWWAWLEQGLAARVGQGAPAG